MSKVSIRRGVKKGEVKNEESEVSDMHDTARRHYQKRWTESQQYLNHQRDRNRCLTNEIR